MYVEITKSVNADRGKIVPLSEVTSEPRGHELYISLFPFDKSIIDYVQIKGTIKEHTGKHFCPYIAFDIDNDTDLNESKSRALDLITRFIDEYGLYPNDLSIYFSGSKGFHVVLNGNTYGFPDPNESMGSIIKQVCIELAGEIKIDSVIYENHRLFRVENSLNAKTSLYKIQLSYDELFSLSVDEIRELAKRPRMFVRKKGISEIRLNEKINRIVRAAFMKTSEPEEVRKFEDGFFLPSTKGERNNKLYKQAFFLFVNTDLHEKSIREIITSINNSGPDPLPLSEVNTIINSARSNRKKGEKEPLKIVSIADLWSEFLSGLQEENNKIDLSFKSLNELFKGKQRGNLGIVLGYGGAKKSMYGQNICYDNIRVGCRCIYSNMEMSTAKLAERFINIIFDGGTTLASIAIENELKQGRDMSAVFKQLNEVLSDKLIVSENSNMTSARYDELIEKITTDRGRVDLLIVDGMSMMGGTGTEVERANEHSKSLKELAKKWNILIVAITHVSKGEDLMTRDLTRKARGSEKIIDNADWIMTLSQIKQGIDYLPDAGIYHLWDKRGTGKRVQKVWEFDPFKLRMKESDKDESQLGIIRDEI